MNICSKNERKTIETFAKEGNVTKSIIATTVTILWCVLILPITITIFIIRNIEANIKAKHIFEFIKELERVGTFNKLEEDALDEFEESMMFSCVKKIYDAQIKYMPILCWPMRLIYKELYKNEKRYVFLKLYDDVTDAVMWFI